MMTPARQRRAHRPALLPSRAGQSLRIRMEKNRLEHADTTRPGLDRWRNGRRGHYVIQVSAPVLPIVWKSNPVCHPGRAEIVHRGHRRVELPVTAVQDFCEDRYCRRAASTADEFPVHSNSIRERLRETDQLIRT